MKAVVLDMDETLGAFTAFSNYVKQFSPVLVSSALFNQMLDQNPQYLRPGILHVLGFLRDNRRLGRCQIVLYTNNQNPAWVKLVQHYLEAKVGFVFDAVIQGWGHEKKRTSSGKCVADLFACARLDKKTRLFFADDQFHPGMAAANVHYFQITPYFEPCPEAFPNTQALLRQMVHFLQQPEEIK